MEAIAAPWVISDDEEPKDSLTVVGKETCYEMGADRLLAIYVGA